MVGLCGNTSPLFTSTFGARGGQTWGGVGAWLGWPTVRGHLAALWSGGPRAGGGGFPPRFRLRPVIRAARKRVLIRALRAGASHFCRTGPAFAWFPWL